eukprot:sb/3465386/
MAMKVKKNPYDSIKPPEMSFDEEDGEAPIKSLPHTTDIWELCIQATERANQAAAKGGDQTGASFLRPSLIFPGVVVENQNKSSERTIFVVGAKSSGKTGIILRFLDRDEQPKATTALEYTFGRRSRNDSMSKDVAHVYELGGGVALSNLIEIPVTKECVQTLNFVIVVDLSKPETIWTTLESLLAAIRQRVKKVIHELKVESPSAANNLVAECLARYDADHPDKDSLDIIPVPITIIGSKYDVFQNFDSEKKKIISRTLRYVAHHHGAHLCYFSSKIETLVMRARGLLGHLVFKTQLNKTTSTDHNKPIYMLAGMDAVSQIGSPPPAPGSRSLLEQWKQLFLSSFPQESEAAMPDDPTKDKKYNEPIVDSVRLQKDEELERFRKAQERKMRQSAAQQQ